MFDISQVLQYDTTSTCKVKEDECKVMLKYPGKAANALLMLAIPHLPSL